MLTTLYFAQLLYMPTVLIYANICFYICNSYRFYYSYMAIAALLLFFVAIQQILFGSSCCSFAELNYMQTSLLSSTHLSSPLFYLVWQQQLLLF